MLPEGQQHVIAAPDDADAPVPMVEWVGLLPRLDRSNNEILERKLPYLEKKAAKTIKRKRDTIDDEEQKDLWGEGNAGSML
ncbi:hypothetical protein Y032_0176g559 [Ancylostoma ceylanicum]|uniref:Uncharacterized protein n=1 Tax=Ancylostoma ceylanicum TaxID=53326 RepID=A0A016SUK4_9BILA|nr:hypothetical protein Y032_0176g559 [Ancylostoma ceylanicum]